MQGLNRYKKIIKKEKTRMNILKLFSFIPTRIMLKIQYRIKFKRNLNFKNPIRYTEKIQKYKLKYRNPKMIECADKFEVRKYVESKGLKNILVDNYGVYNNIKEVDFNIFPNEFIMKSTNGSGARQVIIIKDKEKININEIRKQTKDWCKKTSMLHAGREYSYHKIKGRIIIEQLLISSNKDYKKVEDYKFFCFNGKVEYVKLVFQETDFDEGNIYDREWNHLFIESDDKYSKDIKTKPENFDLMIEIAEQLSNDFPHVRIDLYNVDGKIYFGEMTFYPWSGYINFNPDEFDIEMGEKFNYY